MVSNSKSKEILCDECGKTFTERKKLTLHRKLVHSDNKAKFPCQQCEKSFTVESNLKRHVRNAHDEARAKNNKPCPHCKYVARDGYDLVKHSRCHSQEKPYWCKKCQKGFSQQSSLKNHVEVCSGPRNQCQKCKETFNTKQALNDHFMWSAVCGTVAIHTHSAGVEVNLATTKNLVRIQADSENDVMAIKSPEDLLQFESGGNQIYRAAVRKVSCGVCAQCQTKDDCGKCKPCRSMRESATSRQKSVGKDWRCSQRKCLNPVKYYKYTNNKKNTFRKAISKIGKNVSKASKTWTDIGSLSDQDQDQSLLEALNGGDQAVKSESNDDFLFRVLCDDDDFTSESFATGGVTTSTMFSNDRKFNFMSDSTLSLSVDPASVLKTESRPSIGDDDAYNPSAITTTVHQVDVIVMNEEVVIEHEENKE